MAGSMTFTKCKVLTKVELNAYKDLQDASSDGDPSVIWVQQLVDTLADGSGADQGNLAYKWSGTLAPGGTYDIDLIGSSRTTAFGDALNFTLVKLLYVENSSAAATIRIGGIGATAAVNWIGSTAMDGSEFVIVGPGGVFLLYRPDLAGYAVSAGADVIRLYNKSSSVATYKVMIIGVEANESSSSSSTSSSSSSTNSSSSSHSVSSSSSSSSSTSSSSSSAQKSSSSSGGVSSSSSSTGSSSSTASSSSSSP